MASQPLACGHDVFLVPVHELLCVIIALISPTGGSRAALDSVDKNRHHLRRVLQDLLETHRGNLGVHQLSRRLRDVLGKSQQALDLQKDARFVLRRPGRCDLGEVRPEGPRPEERVPHVRRQESHFLFSTCFLGEISVHNLLKVEVGVLVPGAILPRHGRKRFLQLHAVLRCAVRSELVEHVGCLERSPPVLFQHAIPELLQDVRVDLELRGCVVRGHEQVLHMLGLRHHLVGPRDLEDHLLELRREKSLHLPQDARAPLRGVSEGL
mmetsp:Transcript_40119/g.125606  ORF Transcript_40119/g.125606 Transcript_40119/m.125606 type:complete len:267 (+) Transcript_40119:597-1397(+)